MADGPGTLLDQAVPRWDVRERHQRVVAAPVGAVWRAVLDLTVGELSVTHALMRVRTLCRVPPGAHDRRLVDALPPGEVARREPTELLFGLVSRARLAPSTRVIASRTARPAGGASRWLSRSSGRSRCAPGSAASTSARACCCAAPAGWGECSPFWDYDAAECVPWLRGGARGRRRGLAGAACGPRCRSTSPSPRSGRTRPRPTSSARRPAAAPPRSRSPSPARPRPTTSRGSRRCATRSARRPGPGRRQRRLGRRHRRPDGRGCSTGRPAAGVRRAALPHRRGARRRAPAGRRAGRGRRVDPPGRATRCGWPGWRPPTSRCSRSQPLGGVAGLPADRRADRAAGRRVLRAGDVGRHRRRARARGRAARAALRLRPRHRCSC